MDGSVRVPYPPTVGDSLMATYTTTTPYYSDRERARPYHPHHDLESTAASGRPGPSSSRSHRDQEWTPTRPRTPSNFSAATLENARYHLDGIPTTDHPNEDRYFALEAGNCLAFGVFDGHDGSRVAGFASNYIMELFNTVSWRSVSASGAENIPLALKEFFKAAENDFFKSIGRYIDERNALQAVIPSGMKSYQAYQMYPVEVARIQELEPKIAGGSTAVVVVVCRNQLYVANVGDSRAVLIYEKSDGTLYAEQLTVDHTVQNEDELKRLEALGLDPRELIKSGRLGSQENTRSIGDYNIKEGYRDVDTLRHARRPPGTVSPYVMESRVIDASFRYLVLMTDGVYKSIEEGFQDANSIEANKVLTGMLDKTAGGCSSFEVVSDRILARIARVHRDSYQRSAQKDIRSPVAVACRKRDDMTLLVYKFPTVSAV